MPGENIYDWSATAAQNGSADTAINWVEGQARASVNNSSRSEMAAIAKFRNLITAAITTTGSANVQAFTSGVGYIDIPVGMRVLLKIGFTNTGSTTLNMDSIGPLIVKNQIGGNLGGGELVVNSFAEFLYNGTNWILLQSVVPINHLQDGTIVTGGTTNHYTIVTGLTALYPGLRVMLKIGETNTGPAFLNVDGLGEIEILLQNGESLVGGELLAGSYADLVYDGTHWILLLNSQATIGGKGLVLITSQTASATASIDFIDIDDTYEEYLITYSNVQPAVAGFLRMRYSLDNGATFLSGSDHFWSMISGTSHTSGSFAGSGVSGGGALQAFQLSSTQDLSGPSFAASGEVRLFNPAESTQRKNCLWMTQCHNNTDGQITQYGGGFAGATNAAVNAIRIFHSAGNIATGVFRIYGVEK